MVEIHTDSLEYEIDPIDPREQERHLKSLGLDKKSLGKLRDSYIGRIPETERTISVKFAWHELWSKVTYYLTKEELKKLGEAFVMAADAHGEQKRSSGDPYVVHSIHVASILADMQLDLVTL